jgi:hypothetical protein
VIVVNVIAVLVGLAAIVYLVLAMVDPGRF